MRFLRRNQFALLFVGVTICSLVMVFRQFAADQLAHVQRREDFLLVDERQQKDVATSLYQRLVMELPELTDRTLANDLERTALLLDPHTPQTDSLTWKYHVSVKNELRHRAEHRVEAMLQKQH